MPSGVRLFCIAACVTLTNSAFGQGVALDLPLAPPGDAGVFVAGADVRGARMLRARVSGEYSSEPLVLVTAEQNVHRVVASQLWLRAGLSFAIAHRALVFAELPYLVDSSGDAPPDLTEKVGGPAPTRSLGDARVGTRLRVLGAPDGESKVALGGEVWLPSGSADAYAGAGAVRAHLYAAAGGSTRHSLWSVQVGYLLQPSHSLPSILPTRIGPALTVGARLGLAVDPAARVVVGPELVGSFGVGEGTSLLDPRSTVVHALAAIHTRPLSGALGGALEAGAGFGPGLAQGAGSADFRALAYVGWSPEEPPPPPDRDADGVPDASDVCVSLVGEFSNDPLMNGCPTLPLDTDSDSIPDAFDACPRDAGVPTGASRTHGCPPARDRDGDGVLNEADACPDEAGPSSADATLNGCPPPAPPPAAQLVARRITISEQVQFETGTAVLRESSSRILEEVAAVLRSHPEIELLEVQGHTDDTGTAELNRRLSEARARAVIDWFVKQGVAEKRFVARGYGQDRPIQDNRTESGRALNRRVEFVVLRAAPGQSDSDGKGDSGKSDSDSDGEGKSP